MASHDRKKEVRRLVQLAMNKPRNVPNLSATDVDLLIRLLRSQQLHGRLAADLKQAQCLDSIPDAARDQLESALALAQSRSRVARWEMSRLASVLSRSGLQKIIAVKGAAYIMLNLPNAEGRIFADVDLLISEDQLELLERQLNASGWITRPLNPYDDNYYRRWTHELPPLMHAEREVEVDLHHNILPRTARIKPPAEEIVADALPLEDSLFYVPRDTDIALHAVVHLVFDSDFVDKLRDLVDIRDLLRYFAQDPDFWGRFVLRAEQFGLQRPVYYAIRYLEIILGWEVPAGVHEEIYEWRPPALVGRLMDGMVTRAILPTHPDDDSILTWLSELCLYMRSHWLRMPPWLLAYHLSVKFIRSRLPQPAESG